jgi:hypothetical protein
MSKPRNRLKLLFDLPWGAAGLPDADEDRGCYPEPPGAGDRGCFPDPPGRDDRGCYPPAGRGARIPGARRPASSR